VTTAACIKIDLLKTGGEEHLPYLVRAIFAQMETCSYLIESSGHVMWSVYPVRRNTYVYSTGPEGSGHVCQLRFCVIRMQMLHQLIRVSNVDRAALYGQANPVSNDNFKLFQPGGHRNYYFGNIYYDTQPDQMCGIYREGAVARAYFHEAGIFIQKPGYESQPG